MKFVVAIILLAGFSQLRAQNPPIVTFDAVEEILSAKENDTLYVLNFWATWCIPCVEELPYFEEANKHYANKNVKIILVSIDFMRHYESRLVPFLQNNNIENSVWLLNEPDHNKWIGKVSEEWSGAIPFTLLVNPSTGKSASYEKTFTRHQLFETIELNLK